jgi:hypothetical protein
VLGHALAGQARWLDADAAYQAALAIQHELGELDRAAEPHAGLSRVALKNGDLAVARTHADAILAVLESGDTLNNTDQPLRIYLTCYQVLAATRDQRAASR